MSATVRRFRPATSGGENRDMPHTARTPVSTIRNICPRLSYLALRPGTITVGVYEARARGVSGRIAAARRGEALHPGKRRRAHLGRSLQGRDRFARALPPGLLLDVC